MSTGYLILYYKNSMIESYIRNFLMSKYISLNNAIGSNKLISKIKYYHRNYFCFINKEKNTVRCIIKLGKITNYQSNLEIKSQQEVLLQELKNSEIFKNESKIIENFFNLENNNNSNYINNKINLLIKESNNIYEFNCILLENSFDMGIFEKIKRCMKDKENNHNNEIQNNLRKNPLCSAIFNYHTAFRKKNQENNINKGFNNVSGNNLNNNLNKEGEDKSSYKDLIYFDMKYDKYFLYDELLIDKKQNDDNFFPKNQLSNYNELKEKYKDIFKIADNIFKKPFSELDDIKDCSMISNIKDSPINNKSTESNNINDKNTNISTYKNKEDIKNLDNNLKSIDNKNISNKNNNYNNGNNMRNNNISIIKDEMRSNNDNDEKNKYMNNNIVKKESGNNFSYNNYNNRDYNNYKYYKSNNENNKYSNINQRKNSDKQYSNQMRNNSYNNPNNNYFKNNKNERNDNYMNNRNDNNMRNYSNNDYNYNSSNSSSFMSERGRNYSRSRDRSPFSSPNKNMRYKMESPPQKKYDKYERFNERNTSYKNNNYYGNNNNINYYYNINNYYRPGSSASWNDCTYHHQGNNYQRDNYQQIKSDYYNSNNYYNNYEGHYNRERRRGNQNNNY